MPTFKTIGTSSRTDMIQISLGQACTWEARESIKHREVLPILTFPGVVLHPNSSHPECQEAPRPAAVAVPGDKPTTALLVAGNNSLPPGVVTMTICHRGRRRAASQLVVGRGRCAHLAKMVAVAVAQRHDRARVTAAEVEVEGEVCPTRCRGRCPQGLCLDSNSRLPHLDAGIMMG